MAFKILALAQMSRVFKSVTTLACAKDAVITRATTILKPAHRIRRIGRAIRSGTLRRGLIRQSLRVVRLGGEDADGSAHDAYAPIGELNRPPFIPDSES